MNSPKALITGATGFIGSHLMERLAAESWDLTCWVRPESETTFLSTFPVKILTGNLEDSKALEKAVKDQDYVFHLAAKIHSVPKHVYRHVNFLFTQNLVNACLVEAPQLKRFVYISSIAASGPSSPEIFKTEADPDNPQSEYGRTKRLGEKAVLQTQDKLAVTIIRPPNVIGPRQKETELLIRILKKHLVPKLHSTKPVTSLIYVEDLVEGILKAIGTEKSIGETYYLTDGRSYAWRDLLLTLKQEVLAGSWYIPVPEQLIELAAALTDLLKRSRLIRSYFGRRAWKTMVTTPWLFSSDKAQADFGFRSKYSLEEGLRHTYAAYRNGDKSVLHKKI